MWIYHNYCGASPHVGYLSCFQLFANVNKYHSDHQFVYKSFYKTKII